MSQPPPPEPQQPSAVCSEESKAAATAILEQPPQAIAWHKVVELAYTLPPRKHRVCFGCQQPPPAAASSSLQHCAKCKVAAYCQRSCQVDDWKRRHKVACPSYARMRALPTDPSAAAAARIALLARIRFYAYPYAVHQASTLGRGFVLLQCAETLAHMSLAFPMDGDGHALTQQQRSVHVHYLTVGEYEQEVCRDDFEMALLRPDIQHAVKVYDAQAEVVVLVKFRCGHLALGTSQLVPNYALCKQLGKEYYSNVTAGSLTLNIDE